MEYYKGDVVLAIRSSYGDEGKTGVVAKVENSGCLGVIIKDSNIKQPLNYYPEELQLIRRANQEFKVGDRVRHDDFKDTGSPGIYEGLITRIDEWIHARVEEVIRETAWLSRKTQTDFTSKDHLTLIPNEEERDTELPIRPRESFQPKYKKKEETMFSICEFVSKIAKDKYPNALQRKKRKMLETELTDNQEMINGMLNEKFIEEHTDEILEMLAVIKEEGGKKK